MSAGIDFRTLGHDFNYRRPRLPPLLPKEEVVVGRLNSRTITKKEPAPRELKVYQSSINPYPPAILINPFISITPREEISSYQTKLDYNNYTDVLKEVQRDGMQLGLMSTLFQNNSLLVKQAVSQNGLALQFAGKSLSRDWNIIALAIEQNPRAIRFVKQQDVIIGLKFAIKTDNHALFDALLASIKDINIYRDEIVPLVKTPTTLSFLKKLIEKGFLINFENNIGQTFLDQVLDQDHNFVQALNCLGAREGIVTRCKRLSHAWGLQGTSVHAVSTKDKITYDKITYDYEGWDKDAGSWLMYQSLQKFFSSDLSKQVTGKEYITRVYSDYFFSKQTPADIRRKILTHQPVIMTNIVTTNDGRHLFGAVLFAGLLFLCNRGAKVKSEASSGIEIFEFPIEKATEENIAKIGFNECSIEKYIETFDSLNLKRICKISQKDQKVGNCVLASYKSIILVLFYLMDPVNFHASYKKFTTFLRKELLLAYVKEGEEDLDLNLLIEIGKKLNQKPQLADLKQYLGGRVKQLLSRPRTFNCATYTPRSIAAARRLFV